MVLVIPKKQSETEEVVHPSLMVWSFITCEFWVPGPEIILVVYNLYDKF